MVTLYEALGVREDASDDEIKRAYRKAAMRAHPDRNKGREAAAHDAFQEIKQAYAILSDPEQRRVYDAVFAREMSRLRDDEERQARERAEREAQAQRERYEKYVAIAMRYAERGYKRDVVFGVLLGRGCDEALAARIAHGVAALSASRASAPPVDNKSKGRREPDESAESAAPAAPPQTAEAEPASHAGLFSTLWHGMFGIRP